MTRAEQRRSTRARAELLVERPHRPAASVLPPADELLELGLRAAVYLIAEGRLAYRVREFRVAFPVHVLARRVRVVRAR